MSARTLAQFQPTDGEIALNAYIFGFAGHSLVTPHAALKQLWWTEQRINAKVTKSFIISKLRGEERAFLNRSPLFGDLTDHTYLEWILAKAKRLFLILLEVGIPDQIFGCIDDSWTDEDLPISIEDIPQLELSYDNDIALNHRFHNTQYRYLLRVLHQREHIDYGFQEHIPIEYVSSLPSAASLQSWDRMHLPGAESAIYVRRKFSLFDDQGSHLRDSFLKDVKHAQSLEHRHIAPIWASYVAENHGYTISNFVPEHTLRSFIQHRNPARFARMAQTARLALLYQWMHCLADAIACMHHHGVQHGAIKPSDVLIDVDNTICFADIGSIATLQRGKKKIRGEEDDYSAPEMQSQSISMQKLPFASRGSLFSFPRSRKPSISTSSSSSISDTSSAREWRGYSMETSRTSLSSGPSCNYSLPSLSFDQSSLLSECTSPSLTTVASRYYQGKSMLRSPSSMLSSSVYSKRPVLHTSTTAAGAADIYSLGCIFLDILTFMVKGKLNDFTKFRSSKLNGVGSKLCVDTSFHANAEKVIAWMVILKAESLQHTDAIFHGMPAMLRLVERMLMPDALLRPTADQVRDTLFDILTITCGVDKLCCSQEEHKS